MLSGERFDRPVVTMVGRVHYGGIRIIGTAGSNPAESMKYIPKTGEIRHGDRINVVGAGGPMGMMHVIRNVCQGIEGVSVFAGDVDDNRLAALTRIAEPLAEKNDVEYQTYNAKNAGDAGGPHVHGPDGPGAGAGGRRRAELGGARHHQHLRRHPGDRQRTRSTWTPTSRSGCTSSGPAARRSTI